MIIRIHGMALRANIGVHPWEKEGPRPVTIDLDVTYDASRAASSDRIEDALDYSRLEDALAGWVETSRFDLLEALAAGASSFLLTEFAIIDHVRIAVTKPGILRHTPAVTVQHEQSRA